MRNPRQIHQGGSTLRDTSASIHGIIDTPQYIAMILTWVWPFVSLDSHLVRGIFKVHPGLFEIPLITRRPRPSGCIGDFILVRADVVDLAEKSLLLS